MLIFKPIVAARFDMPIFSHCAGPLLVSKTFPANIAFDHKARRY
jgi:hypothetical protein